MSTASDIYPLGMMLCRLLGAVPVGEVRKFRILPMPDGRREYDLLYNPFPSLSSFTAITSGDWTKWGSFIGTCLRFTPAERPASAVEFSSGLNELLENHPLRGTIKVRLAGGAFTAATLVDGTDYIARVLEDTTAEREMGSTARQAHSADELGSELRTFEL